MPEADTYRMPAEWEPQSGVQLTWPHRDTDWAPMLDEVLATYREMAREISRREKLLVVAPEGSAPGMVHVTCPTNDTWARDHGFITLVGKHANCKLLDFRFDGWGGKFPADLDNAINRRLYDTGAVRGEYVSHLDFVLEGGSIESDGRGTILTTSSCLLDPHRRAWRLPQGKLSCPAPDWASAKEETEQIGASAKAETEQRLCEWLCADRVLWIDHGHLTGDDTDGHIDTLVRIAPNDTLLYVGCDNPHDEQYQELRLMEEQLHTFRTIDGRPYRLLKLPCPRPIYDSPAVGDSSSADGFPTGTDRLPATYANFLVVNGAVLVPTYAQPDLDAEAMRTIARAFPDRDIVGIDCRPLIQQHGSLHCCTMQFPERVISFSAPS